MKGIFDVLTQNLSDDKIVAADALSDIAVELVNYRISNNLDQKDMARILNVSQPMISKYESGAYNFTIKTLFEIAYKLGLDIDFSIHSSTSNNTSSDTSVHLVKEKKKTNPYSLFFNNDLTPVTNSFVTSVA